MTRKTAETTRGLRSFGIERGHEVELVGFAPDGSCGDVGTCGVEVEMIRNAACAKNASRIMLTEEFYALGSPGGSGAVHG
jgi:hypothetical protein